MRRFRRLRWVLLGLLTLLILGLGGFWYYLNTASAAQMVARKLTTSLETPVEVQSLSVGSSETTLTRVKIQEPDQKPLAQVEKLTLDLSFWNLLFNRDSVELVRISEPEFTLRFDADGRLLTRFPRIPEGTTTGRFPTVNLDRGKVTIHQEGRPTVTFSGVNLSLNSVDREVKLSGEVDDSVWGRWTVRGSFDLDTQASWASLETIDSQSVNPKLLETTPFVPARVWQNVEVEAETHAEILLRHLPATRGLSYRVTLSPRLAKVHVTSIDLRTENTAGEVIIEDGLVTLARLRGDTAKGLLKVDGSLDFRGEDESVLRLQVSTNRLDVRLLPEIWGIPKQLEGRLLGEAKIVLHLPWQGPVRTSGNGRGVVTQAKLLGWPVQPIVIGLGPVPTPMGFAFQPMPKEPPPKLEPIRTWPVQLLRGIAYLLNPEKDGKTDTSFLTLNLNLYDISIRQGLKELGIELPPGLDGKVTLNVAVGIPTDSADDWRTYRIKGTVSSKQLQLDELPLEKVEGTIEMNQGIVTLSELTADLPGAGSVRLLGSLTLSDAYPFRATVSLNQAPLNALEKFIGKLPFDLAGKITTQASLHGNLQTLFIEGDGTANVRNLRVGIFPLDQLDFRWKLDRDQVAFTKIDASAGTGKVTGELTIPLTPKGTGTAGLKIDRYDLAEISKQFPNTARLKLDGTASGSLKLTIPAADARGERQISAEVDLQAPKLKLQNLPAERITGTATYQNRSLKYRLMGDALGGKFEVDGQYPPVNAVPKLPKNEPPLGRLQLKNLHLSRLWAYLGLESLKPLEGEISLDLPYRTDDENYLVGVGNLRLDRPRWNEKEITSRISATLRITQDTIRVENLSSTIGEGSLRGLLIVNRLNPDRSRLRLTMSNLPIQKLLCFVPSDAESFDAPLDLTISGQLGREIRLSGTAAVTRGKLYGIPVADLRVPIEFSWMRLTGRGELRLRDISGMIGGGRVTGKAELDFASSVAPRFDTELQFTNVNVQALTSQSGYFSGSTPLSGRLDLHATEWKSVDDLRGSLHATERDGRAFAIPVLSDLLPFIGLAIGSGTQIGEIEAILNRGIWKLQKFTLTGNGLDLMATGTVSLRGQLDLDVTARTGRDRLSSRLLQLAAVLPLGSVGIPPTLATEATRLLADRLLYLEVTGTVQKPNVRLKPLRILSDEALRFFLGRLSTMERDRR